MRTRLRYGESIARLVRIALGVFAALLYTWIAAVRGLPTVRRRKASRRAARGSAAVRSE